MKLNPVLERLTPYRAGPPLAAVQRRYNLAQIARLSANESPEGPFPEVIEAVKQAASGLNRYPDGWCAELREALAAQLNIPEGCLVFGNGSCELLTLLADAFLGPDRHVVFPMPSFVMYRLIALANSTAFTAVIQPDLRYNVDALVEAVRDDTTLLIVCNPNNPTGDYLDPRQLRALIDRVPDHTVVVLDEAYGEFVTAAADQDTAPWIADYPNLVVLRTLSKAFGLAGVRCGVTIASPALIGVLQKIIAPYPVPTPVRQAALFALSAHGLAAARDSVQGLVAERKRLAAALAALPAVRRVWPSDSNFLLFEVVDSARVMAATRAAGVVLRDRSRDHGLANCVRMTMGTPGENNAALEIITRV